MTEEYVRYDYAWKTPGWTVQNPSFPVVSPDTFYDPGLPVDVSTVRVFGNFIDWKTGRALEGTLSVRTSKVLTYQPTQTLVFPGVVTMRFTKGEVSILLPATDDPQLTPNDWTYHFRLTVQGVVQEFEASIAAALGEVNVVDLIPLTVS